MTRLSDRFQRLINYLRISVTDRCNLRCIYCMPHGGMSLLPHGDILTYEEITAIAKITAELGITKIRLTGGEPLVRANLSRLVAMLAEIETIDDISLTTNGTLLSQYANELKQAGLKRVNVSLDTLRQDRFELITRYNKIGDVLQGIDIARAVDLNPVKLNMVVMRGINDDEVLDFAGMSITEGWHVRFIELMPFSPPRKNLDSLGEYSVEKLVPSEFVSGSDIWQCIRELGELEPHISDCGNGPAQYFHFRGSTGTIGFISPITQHFCPNCNRLRLTAEGKIRPCLLGETETNLRLALRNGASTADLKRLIWEAVAAKPEGHHLAEGLTQKKRPMNQIGG